MANEPISVYHNVTVRPSVWIFLGLVMIWPALLPFFGLIAILIGVSQWWDARRPASKVAAAPRFWNLVTVERVEVASGEPHPRAAAAR